MPILHPTRTLQALLPLYVTRFSCIGPACEDNCCSGWQVTLDKKTFNAYRQSNHPDLKAGFAENVKRQRSQASEVNYGRIELSSDTQACPFMVDKLCSVHAKMDESHLSDTCFSYPRQSRNFGGQYEQALQLSCPEAARQALLAPDAFDFVKGPITVRANDIDTIGAKRGVSLELMNELRIFCLQLVRTEGMELWQRLALLGVFCDELSTAFANGRHAAVPALMDDFAALIEQGVVLEALGGTQPDHPAQALVFSTLWAGKAFVSHSEARNEMIAIVAHGLGADAHGQVAPDRLIDCYTRGVARLPEALQATPHLLEHYILNEMFIDLFPFAAADPYDSYLQLVARFGLLRLMLAGLCNASDLRPDASMLVQAVQVHCRRFQHDNHFAKRVNESLKNSGRGSLARLYPILRS